MIIEGMYYKTISRNVKTGETGFYITPYHTSGVKTEGGLLFCVGKIGIFSKGVPICLTGDVVTGSFVVTDYSIPAGNKAQSLKLLDYVDEGISESTREKIVKIADNNLLEFIKKDGARDALVKEILPKSKLEQLCTGEADEKTKTAAKKAIKLADRIISKISLLLSQEEMTRELLKCGVDAGKIEALCAKNISADDIRKNPYITMLRFDIQIGACEMFAGNSGVCTYDDVRICGFIYDALNYALKQGDTCVLFDNLLGLVNKRLSVYSASCMEVFAMSKSILYYGIMRLKKYMSIHEYDGALYVYFNEVWEEEEKVVSNIKRLNAAKKEVLHHGDIDDIEKRLGIKYNDEQRNVFNALSTTGIKILTGPPGSGKTAVVKGLMEYAGQTCRLSATTGMAAKVMSKACSAPADTVHRMLKLTPYADTLRGRDLNNPIDGHLIVVDEMSMCGLKLFSALLGAVKSDSVLLLVGDEDQLQSVEYGNVLHDLIKSGVAEVYRLKKVLRQSGSICENAEKINHGITCLTEDEAFVIRRFETGEQGVDELKKNAEKESTILAPIKSSSGFGTNYLNDLFQDKSGKVLLSYGNTDYRLGDRVVMTDNNYEAEYVNGDMGIITDMRHGCLVVNFDGEAKEIPRQNMSDMELAYALTVHKSQGSGFDDVHILLPKQAQSMMTRRLLYTAVTRAKKRVVIYDVGGSVNQAIANVRERKRFTLLSNLLEKN